MRRLSCLVQGKWSQADEGVHSNSQKPYPAKAILDCSVLSRLPLADDPSWNSPNHFARFNILCDDCSRPNDGRVPDVNSVEYPHPTPDPDIGPDVDASTFQTLVNNSGARLREIVVRRNYDRLGGYSCGVSNPQPSMPVNYAARINRNVIPDLNITTV
jgi:hypothetical protein